ncbi:MAG: hypothetical protein GY801_36425 [bacterium]|nr:hypothetical protein [bacterium]
MSEAQNIHFLPKAIRFSLEELGLERLAEQMELDLQTTQSGDFKRETSKNIIFSIFIHIQKDESVLENYFPMLKQLAQHDKAHHILSKSIIKQGRCPKFARTSIKKILGESTTENNTEIKNTTQILSVFQDTINDVLGLSHISRREMSVVADVIKSFEVSMKRVKKDLIAIENYKLPENDVPFDITILTEEAKNYYRESDEKRSHRFLQLAKIYAEKGVENLLRFALIQYCFSMGRQRFRVKKRDARPYLCN